MDAPEALHAAPEALQRPLSDRKEEHRAGPVQCCAVNRKVHSYIHTDIDIDIQSRREMSSAQKECMVMIP